MSRSPSPLLTWVVVGALAAANTGCSGNDAGRYIPTPTVAKEALTAALEAWRRGEPAGTVKSYRVTIQVADTVRRPGQKLKAFEILGEVGEDGGRIFQVRLQLENPDAEEKAQYIVVGIDPLWVFRREDYNMVTHWEHASPPPESSAVNPPGVGTAGAR